MNLQSEWLGAAPQLNPCNTWQARVTGGTAGSMPVMQPGFYLISATDLGGGSMILSGTYQGPAIAAPAGFVDAAGGPDWTVTTFTPSADPSLTWNTSWSQCMPTPGFNPGGTAGGGTSPQPSPPIIAAPIQITKPTLGPPIQIAAPGAAPASSSSSTATTAWIAGGLATAAGLLWWALK